jgi:hypothetical protein
MRKSSDIRQLLSNSTSSSTNPLSSFTNFAKMDIGIIVLSVGGFVFIIIMAGIIYRLCFYSFDEDAESPAIRYQNFNSSSLEGVNPMTAHHGFNATRTMLN